MKVLVLSYNVICFATLVLLIPTTVAKPTSRHYRKLCRRGRGADFPLLCHSPPRPAPDYCPVRDGYYRRLVAEALHLDGRHPGQLLRGRARRQAVPDGPCVRREYRALSDADRQAFHAAVNALKNDTTVEPNKYDAIALLHSGAAALAAHGGPGFSGWHRIYLLMFEAALREVSPALCLPYWDAALDASLPHPSQSPVWSANFLGTPQGPVVAGPFANWTLPGGAALTRAVGLDGELLTPAKVEAVMAATTYDEIITAEETLPESDLELHFAAMQMYVGGSMGSLATAAFDPAYFLLHANADRIWDNFRANMRQIGEDPTMYPEVEEGEAPRAHMADARMGLGEMTQADGYAGFLDGLFTYQAPPQCSLPCPSRHLSCPAGASLCLPAWPVQPISPQTTSTATPQSTAPFSIFNTTTLPFTIQTQSNTSAIFKFSQQPSFPPAPNPSFQLPEHNVPALTNNENTVFTSMFSTTNTAQSSTNHPILNAGSETADTLQTNVFIPSDITNFQNMNAVGNTQNVVFVTENITQNPNIVSPNQVNLSNNQFSNSQSSNTFVNKDFASTSMPLINDNIQVQTQNTAVELSQPQAQVTNIPIVTNENAPNTIIQVPIVETLQNSQGLVNSDQNNLSAALNSPSSFKEAFGQTTTQPPAKAINEVFGQNIVSSSGTVQSDLAILGSAPIVTVNQPELSTPANLAMNVVNQQSIVVSPASAVSSNLANVPAVVVSQELPAAPHSPVWQDAVEAVTTVTTPPPALTDAPSAVTVPDSATTASDSLLAGFLGTPAAGGDLPPPRVILDHDPVFQAARLVPGVTGGPSQIEVLGDVKPLVQEINGSHGVENIVLETTAQPSGFTVQLGTSNDPSTVADLLVNQASKHDIVKTNVGPTVQEVLKVPSPLADQQNHQLPLKESSTGQGNTVIKNSLSQDIANTHEVTGSGINLPHVDQIIHTQPILVDGSKVTDMTHTISHGGVPSNSQPVLEVVSNSAPLQSDVEIKSSTVLQQSNNVALGNTQHGNNMNIHQISGADQSLNSQPIIVDGTKVVTIMPQMGMQSVDQTTSQPVLVKVSNIVPLLPNDGIESSVGNHLSSVTDPAISVNNLDKTPVAQISQQKSTIIQPTQPTNVLQTNGQSGSHNLLEIVEQVPKGNNNGVVVPSIKAGIISNAQLNHHQASALHLEIPQSKVSTNNIHDNVQNIKHTDGEQALIMNDHTLSKSDLNGLHTSNEMNAINNQATGILDNTAIKSPFHTQTSAQVVNPVPVANGEHNLAQMQTNANSANPVNPTPVGNGGLNLAAVPLTATDYRRRVYAMIGLPWPGAGASQLATSGSINVTPKPSEITNLSPINSNIAPTVHNSDGSASPFIKSPITIGLPHASIPLAREQPVPPSTDLISLTSSSLAKTGGHSRSQSSYYSDLLSVLRGVKMELQNQNVPQMQSHNKANNVNSHLTQTSVPIVKQFDNQYLKRLLSGLNTLEKGYVAAMPQKQNSYYDRHLFGLNPKMQAHGFISPSLNQDQSALNTIKSGTKNSPLTEVLRESQQRANQVFASNNQAFDSTSNKVAPAPLSLPSYYDGLLNSFPTAKGSNPEGKVTVYQFVPGQKSSTPLSSKHVTPMKLKEPARYYADLVNTFTG